MNLVVVYYSCQKVIYSPLPFSAKCRRIYCIDYRRNNVGQYVEQINVYIYIYIRVHFVQHIAYMYIAFSHLGCKSTRHGINRIDA